MLQSSQFKPQRTKLLMLKTKLGNDRKSHARGAAGSVLQVPGVTGGAIDLIVRLHIGGVRRKVRLWPPKIGQKRDKRELNESKR